MKKKKWAIILRFIVGLNFEEHNWLMEKKPTTRRMKNLMGLV